MEIDGGFLPISRGPHLVWHAKILGIKPPSFKLRSSSNDCSLSGCVNQSAVRHGDFKKIGSRDIRCTTHGSPENAFRYKASSVRSSLLYRPSKILTIDSASELKLANCSSFLLNRSASFSFVMSSQD